MSRITVAAAVFVPALLAAGPALAATGVDPGNPDQGYRSTTTSSTPQGTRTSTVTSCPNPDGSLSYQRVNRDAGPDGRTVQQTSTGDANCSSSAGVAPGTTGDNFAGNNPMGR